MIIIAQRTACTRDRLYPPSSPIKKFKNPFLKFKSPRNVTKIKKNNWVRAVQVTNKEYIFKLIFEAL